ncbi:LysR substrate-binding domain-containing protein [Phenylobacterium aquaticum]|uniref:LysR substrate-binding domain-containing protein n=1 Tax=Phenylobacterium aquaticum TaxID=1763816 RepID=UPI0026E92F3E|nr:LysR substrate-binding domain-containing protein [Phenylobacterium aquaticum]
MPDPLAQIPLSAIRVFEAAARLGGFTRAAEELGITQAAVSWQVKALERRLGLTLFRRLTREVVLTPPGERLARAATEAMGGLRAALSDITGASEGVLSITTMPSLATQWLAPRLGAFQLAHPKIAVRLETSTHTIDLVRENTDVALRGGDGRWPGLETHHLFGHIQTPLCTEQTRQRLGGLAHPSDLLAAPRIGSEAEWALWFAAAGVAPPGPAAGPRLAGDAQTFEVASALAGHGVALGSPIFFAAEIAQGRLVQPFDIAPAYGPGYWLAYPVERARVPKIAAFRDWLMTQVATDPAAARALGQEVMAAVK